MHYYNKYIEDITEEFRTDLETGLTAKQVIENRKWHGENRLEEKAKKSHFRIFLEQFQDLMVILLIVAALISAATGSFESSIVIIVVLIMNATLGTVQTIKAEQSLESLKKLSSPSARVLRDGEQQSIDAAELVCGDIVILEAGDIIPGDGRLIECHSLKTNESSLTGESQSVEKHDGRLSAPSVALGDQTNMIFSGTLVTYGRGKAVVTGVGHSTELGRIANLMNDTSERKTPLQVSMDRFSKQLSIGIMIICAVVMLLSLYRGLPMIDALLFAVALAVAAIPEALSSIITISLAIGTARMADQNAIIKNLDAVEGLGCVSVICSDKTGTLTQNKMTVDYVGPWGDRREEMLRASILCNDSAFVNGNLVGDPTETAFVTYYQKDHEDYDAVRETLWRRSEVPFDSDRKLMSTLHKVDGQYIMYTKGALDVILARASNLSPEEIEQINRLNTELSGNGLRVLAFARRVFTDSVELTTNDEYDLEYIGLMAEVDPPREESTQAVLDCIQAGIKPIMITGDHPVTASAIARRIGIMRDGDMALTGPELDALSEDDLSRILSRVSVYARVSPDNKIRIVRAWQEAGAIVAMTGDGVNDGPALKSADVGVAMGITGTEVAKDSASMILTDDNFATIIKSVLNGRNIYNNIKNAIKYLLSGNASGILAVLYASLAALPMPFTAVQLLFINLITDSLPALAISMEPSNPALLSEKPRPRTESVLNRPALLSIGTTGILIAIATIVAFHIGLGSFRNLFAGDAADFGSVTASTMAFSTLCLARLWHGFNCRGNESIFRLGITRNLFSIGAFVLGAALLHMLLLVPAFSGLFSVATLNPALLFWVWILAFLPTAVIQIRRIVIERKCS